MAPMSTNHLAIAPTKIKPRSKHDMYLDKRKGGKSVVINKSTEKLFQIIHEVFY